MNPSTVQFKRLVLCILTLLLPRPDIRADVISEWNKSAFDYLGLYAPSSVHLLRGMAMVHVAQFDAVNAVVGGYTPYAANLAAPTASAEAAAAQAAYTVLTNVNQASLATLNAVLTRSLSAVSNGVAKDQGILLGRAAANAVIQLRAGDSPDLQVPANTSTAIGRWRPTPPSFTPAYGTHARYAAPWTMRSAAQFRPGPPPALTSTDYTADYLEIQAIGSIGSATRTAAQTEAARFQEAGVSVHQSLLQNVATNHPLPLVQSARLFALAYMAVHDGQIQVFDSKYTYNFWRPITAIQAGAADNNPDTVPDGSWKPLLETPPHPEYPAAHSEETAALLEVLKSVHGDGTAVTISSPNTSQPRTFASFSELLRDVNDARVWAGAHFRTACLVGSDVGQRIARHALQNYLRPLPVLTPDAQANPGEFQFSFTSGPLASYVVERSNDLTQWLPVTTNIYGAFSFADVSVGDVDHRFYRVRQFNP